MTTLFPGSNDSEFWVCSGQCDECLFTQNRLVSPERAEQIIQDCLANDNWFQCHKFSVQGRKVCCRGFWNHHRKDVWPLRLAQLFIDSVKFVDPPEKDEK